MFRRGCPGGRLHAERALEIEAVTEVSCASSIREAGLDRAALSAEIFQPAARVQASVPRMDIDDALVAVAELGGHKIVDQAEVLDEIGAEELTEAAHRLGQKNSVEPVLYTASVEPMNVDLSLPLAI